MATQAEQAKRLEGVVATLSQVAKESDELIAKVAELQLAVENQPNATPELVAAVDAVESLAKGIDEKVPAVQA